MAAESSIEKSFGLWCKRVRYLTLKLLPNPAIKGWPDRPVLLPGNKVAWIEFKAPNGTVSEHQLEVAKQLAEFGHDVHFCRSNSDAQIAIQRVLGSGEDDAIASVLEYGKKYGYGNLIEKLQDAWAESLRPGLSESAAKVMAGIVCSECNTTARE